MSVSINGQTYYRTAEACSAVGIGKSTLFRWIKKGITDEARHSDRRGWRLFTKYEIEKLKVEANRIRSNHSMEGGTK